MKGVETKIKEDRRNEFSAPDEIEVLVMSRDVWNAYCNHGSAIDPNTGCDPKGVTTLLPDKDEADEWHRRRECKIGSSCSIDQRDCMGDGALKCIDNTLTRWVKIANEGYGAWWLRFPHQTCSKLLNCQIRESKITPVIINEETLGAEINILDEWFTIYKEGRYTNYFKSEKNKIVVYVPDFTVEFGSSLSKCVAIKEKTNSLVTNSVTGNQEIIELTKSNWSVGRTVAR